MLEGERLDDHELGENVCLERPPRRNVLLRIRLRKIATEERHDTWYLCQAEMNARTLDPVCCEMRAERLLQTWLSSTQEETSCPRSVLGHLFSESSGYSGKVLMSPFETSRQLRNDDK